MINSSGRRERIGIAACLLTALVVSAACGSRTPLEEIVAAEGGAAPVAPAQQAEQTGIGAVAGPDVVAAPAQAAGPAGPARPSGSEAGGAAAGSSPAGGTRTTGKTVSGTAANTTATAQNPAQCTTPLEPIRIGQVGGWTGLIGHILSPTRSAMQVWVKDTNARGGIACHPVQLFQADDASDPARSAAAVQDLVQTKQVVALVGNQLPITVAGFTAKAEELKVPVIGGDLLNYRWFDSPYLFPQGGDLTANVLGSVKVQADRGKKKVGVVYCVESAVCTDAAAIATNQMARAGASLVYKTQVSVTSTDFSAQCQAAKVAGADQLLLAIDAAAISRLVRSCKALNFLPAISTSPIALSSAVTGDQSIRQATVGVGSSSAPWTETTTAAQKRYHQAFAQLAPGTEITGASNVAWVSGELLAKAVSNLGAQAAAPLTKERVLQGLGTIKKETLDGLTLPLNFKPGQKGAGPMPCYFPVLLTPEGWKALQGNKYSCI